MLLVDLGVLLVVRGEVGIVRGPDIHSTALEAWLKSPSWRMESKKELNPEKNRFF